MDSLDLLSGNIAFNAHHAPFGAFFTFTCGHDHAGGGMALHAGQPAAQDIFVGVKEGGRESDQPLRCLPLFTGAQDAAAAAYLVEQAKKEDAHRMPVAFAMDQVRRHYGWASDRWEAGKLRFTIHTPFDVVPDPASATPETMRRALLPAIIAELTVDNTAGQEPCTAVFAIRFPERGVHPLEGVGSGGRLAFAVGRQMGFAAELEADDESPAFAILRWAPDAAMRCGNSMHLLGTCPGVAMEVPPGKRRTLRLVIGCYAEGIITSGLEGRYFYNRHYANLADVLGTALDRWEELAGLAHVRNRELAASGLSADQRFLLAHATRSYYGSTQLLDMAGEPFWIVNEGEYCMINTLDLAVDHLFWQLKWHPWTVRNVLGNFLRRYSFVDQIKLPDGAGGFVAVPGGLSFPHDMGQNNCFAPRGQSSYELPNLDALCFSHMTVEQLCNWVLIAACYVAATGDQTWLREHQTALRDCLDSMLQRDHPDPARRKGIMQLDSLRCGAAGSEITTYDSLDHSLAQSRGSLYIAGKCWATYLALAMLLERCGDSGMAAAAHAAAQKAAETIVQQAGGDGILPAVFENNSLGRNSRILPAIEGLVYPLYWSRCGQEVGQRALAADGPFAELLAVLRRHTQTLLSDPQQRNRFPDGGIRLSSTSGNSWMSKIAIVQHVCRECLGLEDGDDRQRAADAAHVRWQTNPRSAYWAMSDQILDGVAMGSRYYPRCVTTVLWLDEPQHRKGDKSNV